LIHIISRDKGHQDARLHYIKTLIKHKAKFDEVNKYGYTPLDMALMYQNDKVAQFYIDNGVDIEKPNGKGFTPLLTAIGSSRLDSLEYMIATKNPDLNKQTGPNKLSPLKMATLNGKKEILQEILKHDVDLDQQDNEGNTALHYAVLTRNYDKIKLLKDKGANSLIKNKEGISPLDLARRLFAPANPKTAPTITILEKLN
jgi:serine/threonine-protein phosphatase 6 regulatory ankyrin repeat subunit C